VIAPRSGQIERAADEPGGTNGIECRCEDAFEMLSGQ
jgi:hypothetical protein